MTSKNATYVFTYLMQNLKSTLQTTNSRFYVKIWGLCRIEICTATVPYVKVIQEAQNNILSLQYVCVWKLWQGDCNCLGTSISMARPALMLTQPWPCASSCLLVTASVMNS